MTTTTTNVPCSSQLRNLSTDKKNHFFNSQKGSKTDIKTLGHKDSGKKYGKTNHQTLNHYTFKSVKYLDLLFSLQKNIIKNNQLV